MAISLAANISAMAQNVSFSAALIATPGDLFRLGDECVQFSGYQLHTQGHKFVVLLRGRERTTAATHTAGTLLLGVNDAFVSSADEAHPDPFSDPAGAAAAAVAAFDLSAMLMAVSDLYAPPLMAAPPTITQEAQYADSSLASPVTLAKDNAVFQYYGSPYSVGSAFPNSEYFSPGNDQTTTVVRGPWFVRFVHTGPAFEFVVKGSAGTFRIVADGAAATVLSIAGPPADGAYYPILVDFGSSATRTITIEMSPDLYIYRYHFAGTDTIAAPQAIAGPKVVLLGDSYADGTGADAAWTAYPFLAARFLAWGDILAMGAGGTGYLQTGPTPFFFPKIRDRVDTDCIALAPDIVVIAAGINDSAFSSVQVAAEAALLYAEIAAGLPSAELVVVSPWFPRSVPPTQYIIDHTAALATVAAAAGATYIDVTTDPWIIGSGYAGHYTLDGNADRFISADSSHPNQRGHNYLGLRLAHVIANAA